MKLLATIKAKLIWFYNNLKYQFPTRLPQGLTEFEAWSSAIIKHYSMPDNNSVRFALATSIAHLGSTTSHKAIAYFGRILNKGAATQVAFAVMDDLKAKQNLPKQGQFTKEVEAALSDVTTKV